MIFWLIVLGLLLVTAILGKIIHDEDLIFVASLFLSVLTLIVLILILFSVSEKGTITDMRENPGMYSTNEIEDENERIMKFRKLHGSIFSFYNGFDLTYLEVD